MDIEEYSLYEARQQKRRYQLLYEIWLKGPVSRAQLAQDLHLHPPTISTLITDLIAEKATIEHGRAASTGGRKPQLLDVNPDSGSVIGITFTTRGITSA